MGTYGATDGSNGFATVALPSSSVFLGGTRVDASLTFFATQDVQPDAWLYEDGSRAFRGYSDIREELYLGWVSTDLVQMVNRTAMRLCH